MVGADLAIEQQGDSPFVVSNVVDGVHQLRVDSHTNLHACAAHQTSYQVTLHGLTQKTKNNG